MPGSQSDQELTLTLRAQDEASKSIAAVQQALEKLGGINLSGMSESLKAIAPAIEAQDAAVRSLGTATDAAGRQITDFMAHIEAQSRAITSAAQSQRTAIQGVDEAFGRLGTGTGLADLDTQLQGLGSAFQTAGSGARTLTETVTTQLTAQTDATRTALAQQDALWQQGLAQQEQRLTASYAAQTSVVQAGTAGTRTIMAASVAQEGAVIGAGGAALAAATAGGEQARTRALEQGEAAAGGALRTGTDAQKTVVSQAQDAIVAATTKGAQERAAAIKTGEDGATEALRRSVAEQDRIIRASVSQITAQHPMPPSVAEQMVRTQPGEDVPPAVVDHVVNAMEASTAEMERLEAAWEARARAQQALQTRMQVPEPRLEDIPGAFPTPSAPVGAAISPLTTPPLSGAVAPEFAQALGEEFRDLGTVVETAAHQTTAAVERVHQALSGLGAGVSLAGVVAPLHDLGAAARAVAADIAHLADAAKAGMAAMADAIKAGMHTGVSTTQAGAQDMVAALHQLGGGVTLADLSTGVKAAMADAVAAVKDGAAEITAALGQLGQGVSLADLSNQLHDLGQTTRAVADAVKAGFTSMEDAASYGTAAIVDAIRTASVEQVAALKTGLAEELAALKEGLAEQVAARKEAGAKEVASTKESEGLLSGIRERMEKPLEFAKMFIGWEAGMALITAFTEGIHELPKAFVEAATAGEQFQAQMANFYGSTQAAGQVLEWTNQQALKLPFSLDAIRQATASLSEAGFDPGKALGPLANIAAAYHTGLSDLVDTVNRAIATGSTRGLESYLRMTRKGLAEAGVAWDQHGKLISASVLPALEALGASRFGQAAAAQAHTFTGAMQILVNVWEEFKEVAGEGLMDALKARMGNLSDWIQAHQDDIMRWAHAIGEGLGYALGKAMDFATWMVQNVGPPVVAVVNALAVVWQKVAPIVGGAISVLVRAMAGIGTFLHDSVLPVVENAIGQMTRWWDSHAHDVQTVWQNIGVAITKFWDWLGGAAHTAMMGLQGAWTIAWGVMSGVVGVAIDIISGDWKRAKTDLINIWYAIEVGVLEIVNALVDSIIHIFQLLAGPIATVLNVVFVNAFKAVVDVGVSLFTFLALKVEQAFDTMAKNVLNKTGMVATLLKTALAAAGMPEPAIAGVISALTGGGKKATASGLTDAQIAAQAGAAGTGAATAVGGFLGPSSLVPTYTFDDKKVTAQVDAWFNKIETGIDKNLTTGASATGKQWWATFTKDLTAQGIKLPPWTPPQVGGLPPLVGGGGGGGAGGAVAPSASDAVSAANTAFQLFLGKGAPGGWTQGLRDIADIARAEHDAHVSSTQIELDTLRDTNALIDKLYGQATKQFDFDAGVAHPSIKKLHQDENNALAIIAKTPGMTPAEFGTIKQSLDARIIQVTQTGGHAAVRDPQAQLQLAIAQGTLTPALLTGLVGQIIAGERALPAGQRPSDAQIALDTINTYKTGFGALLDQDQKTFQLDADNHAAAQVLRQDTAHRLADLAAEYKAGAITKMDYLLGVHAANQDLTNALKQGQADYQRPREPAYRAYGSLGHDPGFAGINVLFGGPQADMSSRIIAELRQQNATLRAQLQHDEKLLASSRGIERATTSTASLTRSLLDHLGRPISPPHPQNTVGATRRSGAMMPIARP